MRITNDVAMLEATRGIFDYHGRPCSSMVYIVKEADGVTLIDSGFPVFGPAILSELRSNGCANLPLKNVLLTHADLDHMGNAALIQQKTGCKVWLHKDEMDYITGQRPRCGLKQQMAEECGLETPELTLYPDNGLVGNFHIIPTPGHSRGHVCIIFRSVLFGGDLFMFRDGVFTHAAPEWSEDMAEAELSFAKICQYQFTIFCPAHGEPGRRKSFFDPPGGKGGVSK